MIVKLTHIIILFAHITLYQTNAITDGYFKVGRRIRRTFPPHYTKKRTNRRCRSTFKWIWNRSNMPTQKDCEDIFNDDINIEYNHDFVGITNPCEDVNINIASANDHSKNDKKYRVIRIKKKVGKGKDTYELMKNYILRWNPTICCTWAGIRTCSTLRRNCIGEDITEPFSDSISEKVMQIWNRGGRKLATFSRVFGTRLWCMNPCMVVYDLVDVRNEKGIYSSTAYGTLKGHFLSGEECISVSIQNWNDSFFSPKKQNIISCKNDESTTVTHPNLSPCFKQEGDVFVEILSYSCPTDGIIGKVIFSSVKRMQERFFREQMNSLERTAKQNTNNMLTRDHE